MLAVQKKGEGSGFMMKLPSTAAALFALKKNAVMSDRTAPTPKVGSMPIMTPMAAPSAIRSGGSLILNILRYTSRDFRLMSAKGCLLLLFRLFLEFLAAIEI